jgi:hypothetical protein
MFGNLMNGSMIRKAFGPGENDIRILRDGVLLSEADLDQILAGY